MWICELTDGDYAFIDQILDDNTYLGTISRDGSLERDVVITNKMLKEIPSNKTKSVNIQNNLFYSCYDKIDKISKIMRPREGFEPPRDC